MGPASDVRPECNGEVCFAYVPYEGRHSNNFRYSCAMLSSSCFRQASSSRQKSPAPPTSTFAVPRLPTHGAHLMSIR